MYKQTNKHTFKGPHGASSDPWFEKDYLFRRLLWIVSKRQPRSYIIKEAQIGWNTINYNPVELHICKSKFKFCLFAFNWQLSHNQLGDLWKFNDSHW